MRVATLALALLASVAHPCQSPSTEPLEEIMDAAEKAAVERILAGCLADEAPGESVNGERK